MVEQKWEKRTEENNTTVGNGKMPTPESQSVGYLPFPFRPQLFSFEKKI